LFARSLSTESELPDLEARDFDEIELRNHFNLWGLDPGVTHIFEASDDSGPNPHQVRRYSSAEFESLAGYPKTNTRIRELKEEDGVDQVEGRLESYKTADLDIYRNHLLTYFAEFEHV